MVTVEDVARWMLEEVRKGRHLQRERVMHEIELRFGEEFVYQNQRSTISVSRKVLDRLRELSDDEVVWASYSRL